MKYQVDITDVKKAFLTYLKESKLEPTEGILPVTTQVLTKWRLEQWMIMWSSLNGKIILVESFEKKPRGEQLSQSLGAEDH